MVSRSSLEVVHAAWTQPARHRHLTGPHTRTSISYTDFCDRELRMEVSFQLLSYLHRRLQNIWTAIPNSNIIQEQRDLITGQFEDENGFCEKHIVRRISGFERRIAGFDRRISAFVRRIAFEKFGSLSRVHSLEGFVSGYGVSETCTSFGTVWTPASPIVFMKLCPIP